MRGRGRAAGALALALALGAVGTGVAHADHFPVSVAVIDGCNAQPVGDTGLSIRWTSTLDDDDYDFVGTRSGELVTGHGAVLQLNVQWSVVDANGNPVDVATAFVAEGFRGGGFSPGGVEGNYTTGDAAPAPGDAAVCNVDGSAASYGLRTTYFEFTTLHQPGRRGGGVAKGNAQLEFAVDVGETPVRLGTNVHVATGADPDPS